MPAGAEHRYLLPELAAGVPIVFLDRPPGDVEADTVLLDNLGGTRAGVEHLLEQGHERIAFVGDSPELYTARAAPGRLPRRARRRGAGSAR